MRKITKAGLGLTGLLVLTACAAPDQVARLSDPKLGFAAVSSSADSVLGKDTALLMDAAVIEANAKRVHALVHGKTISADTAVQVALLNNRGLQARYAQLGVSSAEAWQSIMMSNPYVTVGMFGINAPGVGAYRTLEATIASNLVDLFTLKGRRDMADLSLEQAQVQAIEDTMSLAVETRKAWIEAVAAFEAAALVRDTQETADAGSELAARLGDTGYLNKAAQAREHAFNAELTGQRAQARLAAQLAKETLTRRLGLWGEEVAYYVPNRLPDLPKRLKDSRDIERVALNARVDLRAAKLALAAAAKEHGLTEATRYASDVQLILGTEQERENDGSGTKSDTRPQVELEFEIPIFDSGKARLKRAEAAYMMAAHELAQKAVNVRSEARAAHAAYTGTHQIARHYRDAVLPLRRTIEEESMLSYNGMITNTFELLTDTRERLDSSLTEAEARKEFWLAEADLKAAIHGGGTAN